MGIRSMNPDCDKCQQRSDCAMLAEHQALSNILYESRDMIFKYSFQSNSYVYVSESVQEQTGYCREEVMRRGAEMLLEHLHPDDKEAFWELYQGMVNNTLTESDISLDYRYRHKDGHYIWRSDHARILRDVDGDITGIAGCSRDITEQVAQQQKLVVSEQRYRTLFQNSRIPLFRTRISDGKIIECNQALATLLGYSSAEECLEKGYSVAQYANPEQRSNIMETLKIQGRIEKKEMEFLYIDGSSIWVEGYLEIFPEEGFLEGGMIDITARKLLSRAERKVLKQLLDGKSNKKIAFETDRSVRTIEDHRASIMRKLGVDNMVDLTKKALALSLID